MQSVRKLVEAVEQVLAANTIEEVDNAVQNLAPLLRLAKHELDPAPGDACAAPVLRDDKVATINDLPTKILYAHLGDLHVAGKVRMLMRDDLNHEAVCTAARDRITYLSELVSEARGVLAQLPSAWPPSQPIAAARRDGTYYLVHGSEGRFTARWQGEYWQIRGTAFAVRDPARFWELPGGQ